MLRKRRSSLMLLVCLSVIGALVCGCEVGDSQESVSQGEPPSGSSDSDARADVDPETNLSVFSEELFDPGVSPREGSEIIASGIVELNTPEKSPNCMSRYARLNVANGSFDILLDEVGERVATERDSQMVQVRGVLTGEASYDMVMSLSTPTSGSVSGAVQVPELRITEVSN